MNDRDFIYWLQGYLEITLQGPAMESNPERFGHFNYPPLGYQQWQTIKHHTKLVISERKEFTHLSSVVDQIAGLVEFWEGYRPDSLDIVYGKIRKLISLTMTKITPTYETRDYDYVFDVTSSVPPGPQNPCFESAEKYFKRGEAIYNNPVGAGIMSC